MAAQHLTILDARTNSFAGSENPSAIAELKADGNSPLAVFKKRLFVGTSEGVDVVRITNGDFTFNVIPTRGMSVHSACYKDEFIGWNSPVNGPVHPKYVDISEPGGLGWLDGFDELLVRCGLESNGAPEHDPETGRLLYPLHGRIANKPAHKVTAVIDGDEITVTGVVDEVRFHFLKLRMTSEFKIRVGENGFRIKDTVENLSQSPAEIQMLYHINFGVPLLDAGSRFIAPVKTLVPRNDHAAAGIDNWDNYEAPQAGFEEQVYFFELLADRDGRTKTMLKNAHGTRGAALSFNQKQLPVLTTWKNTTSISDGYVTGIEPGTNFPNPRTYEGKRGRVTKLAGGGQTKFDLEFEYLVGDRVNAVAAEIKQLQGSTEPTIHKSPQDGWCAP
jgi:hypothetical protein